MLHVCHIAQHGEDHESGQKAGQTINAAGDDGVAITIVVEFVVAGEGEQRAKSGTQREEYLRCGIDPYF